MSAGSVASCIAGLAGVAVLTGSVVALTPAAASDAAPATSHRAVAPHPDPESSRRALTLLERVAAADEVASYRGTQYVSAWGSAGTSSRVVDVRNEPGAGTKYRVRGSGTTPAATVVTESSYDSSLDLGTGPVALVAANYRVVLAGRDRVAGREARVLRLVGADREQAARLWVDDETGVLLRREVYDASGRTIRASSFVKITIDRHPSPDRKDRIGTETLATDAVALTETEVGALRRAGYTCPEALAEGQLLLYQVQRLGDESTLQLSYSDGLSTVSVFELPGRVDPQALATYAAADEDGATRYVEPGPPTRVVWSAGDVTYAVVADAPDDLVAAVVAELPSENPDGIGDRVGRGLGRIASWLNPFD